MVKAVYFDFDGVLVKEGHVNPKGLASKLGVDAEKMGKAYDYYAQDLYAGRVSLELVWNYVGRKAGFTPNMDDLLGFYRETRRNEPMIKLAKALKDDGYITGIITNNSEERMEVLREPFELDFFDPVVVSAEVGYCKGGPYGNREIFERALAKHNLDPRDTVFVDNDYDNLVIPGKMGFRTYLFDHEKNDVSGFVSFLGKEGVRKELLVSTAPK